MKPLLLPLAFGVLLFAAGGRFSAAEHSKNKLSSPPADAGVVYYPKLADALQKETPINGINPKLYDRFWEKWPLVTVHYRTDIHELRFIYANPLAWKYLRTRRSNLPDGSMFAKLAYQTTLDRLFPNSAMPSSAVRVQFMLKNRKKYANTGGWTFALFPKDLIEIKSGKLESITCFACHQIARSRDFAFSLPMSGSAPLTTVRSFRAFFKLASVRDLPANVREALKQNGAPYSGRVKAYQTPLFSGSIVESRPPLAGYAGKEKIPYVLFDRKSGDYLLAVPVQGYPGCLNRVMLASQAFPEGWRKGKTPPPPVEKAVVCNGKVTRLPSR